MPLNPKPQAPIILSLPYERTPPVPYSDALQDLHIRFNEFVNFVGEVLLARSIAEKSPLFNKVSKKQPAEIRNEPQSLFETPTVSLRADKIGDFGEDLTSRLYYNAIVHLATIYEVFLSELMKEILVHNDRLLRQQQKTFTAEEVLKHPSLSSIKQALIDQMILDTAMLSYPKKVEKFERLFHVGLHQKDWPLSLFEMHDLLEIRNVIVHSDGHASKTYVERMKSYDEEPQLKRHQRPVPNFSWLLAVASLMVSLCILIDEKIAEKWTTTRQGNEENARKAKSHTN